MRISKPTVTTYARRFVFVVGFLLVLVFGLYGLSDISDRRAVMPQPRGAQVAIQPKMPAFYLSQESERNISFLAVPQDPKVTPKQPKSAPKSSPHSSKDRLNRRQQRTQKTRDFRTELKSIARQRH